MIVRKNEFLENFVYNTAYEIGKDYFKSKGSKIGVLAFLRYYGCTICQLDIMEFNKLYEKFEEMQTYDFPKGKILVLYCDRGGASLQAARILARNGYKTKTVIGGMKEYRGRNLICDI